MMRTYRRSPLYPSWGKAFAKVLARLPGNDKRVVKTIDGITYELDLAETIDSSLYYSGTFEADTERAIVDRLGPGMNALDIGANVGYHTFRIARAVGPQGRVVAVEPMSSARARLVRNLELNDFQNITIAPVALSEVESGVQPLAFESSYRLDGETQLVTEPVQVTTVDVLVEDSGLEHVDFIKLDVDGYEGKVFRGAAKTLARWHPALVFEISPGAMAAVGDDAVDLVAQLDQLGYSLTYEGGRPIEDFGSLLRKVGKYSINLLGVARDASAGRQP